MLYWYPYEGPLQPIYGRIFQDLMGKGHKITIVTSFPHFRKGREETWDEYRGKLFQRDKWKDAKVVRSYVYAPVFDQRKPGLLYRALNFISFNISCIIAGIFMTGKQDVIFAPSSPPLTNGLCAGIVSLWKCCPIVYNVQDMYPDMAEKLGLIKTRAILLILKRLESIVYKIADKVMLLSEGMRKNVRNKGVPVGKTEIIPNFIDTNFIKPLPQDNPFSIQWGLVNHFIVMYAGNIGLPHGVEFVVEAAERLKDKKDMLFCFVARGENKDKLVELCDSKTLRNTVFIPQQPEDMVPHIWASSDVSLVTSRKGLSGDSVPSKTFAIMASGRPIIAMVDEGSEVWNIVKGAKCGICVPAERADLLVQAILRLYNNEKERKEMGENGRRFVVENFSRKIISRRYEKLFLDVVRDFKLGVRRLRRLPQLNKKEKALNGAGTD